MLQSYLENTTQVIVHCFLANSHSGHGPLTKEINLLNFPRYILILAASHDDSLARETSKFRTFDASVGIQLYQNGFVGYTMSAINFF